MKPRVLEVLLHDRVIGTITNLSGDRNAFAFNQEYLSDERRPTLSLGFHDGAGSVAILDRMPQVRAPAFFSNLLPEGQLRHYLADRGGVDPERDFPLLELLGADLPGAVTIRPADRASQGSTAEIEGGVRPLRFSLAGMQFKFSATMETHGKPRIPSGGTGGDWIVKLPFEQFPYAPENEFAMLTFARKVGIEVPECGLVEPSDLRHIMSGSGGDLGRAFYVKRFDRDGERRVHVEDFNQVFRQHPADKYKNVSYGGILAFIWHTIGEEAMRDFVRRLIFSIGIGNGDMHLKNWGVIYREGRRPELAPAYDYLSTIPYISGDKLALTMAGTRDWSAVSEDLLERFARKAGVPRGIVLEPAREMAARMREAWPKLEPDLDLPRWIPEAINAHMKRVPLLQPA